MPSPYFSGQTLDDVMRSVIEEINASGEPLRPRKGECKELTGVLLEITDPRARLSRSETRGRIFSCLGELCWYLAKSKDVAFITYYLPRYQESADGEEIFGAYGPRLFDWEGTNQVQTVISLLRQNPATRRAVIQLFDRNDLMEEHKDVACTCTLQFMVRRNSLHLFTNMRSNDVFLGLPHDIFCFTMLQEIIARSLSVELGTYKHAVGSLHLYNVNSDAARQFLGEGWQSTENPMPAMPAGDPWQTLPWLLEMEAAIRTSTSLGTLELGHVDPYWADLVRLLRVFRFKKDKDPAAIKTLREHMSWNGYRSFVDTMLNQFS